MLRNDIYNALVQSRMQREIEVRFHGRGMMHKGVPVDTFDSIIAHMSANEQFIKKQVVKMMSYSGVVKGESRGDVRMSVNEKGKQEAIRKIKISHNDISEINVRIAQAQELPIKLTFDEFNAKYDITSTRSKTRRSFVHTSKLWRLDLTKVVSQAGVAPSYEVELEYIGSIPPMNPKDAAASGSSIADIILMLVQKSKYIVPNSFVSSAIQEYQHLLGLRSPTFAGPLPFTISKKQFDAGAVSCGYSVTDKADGLRFLLLVDRKKHAFLISRISGSKLETGMIYVGESKNAPSKSILDGELVDQTFYVFDALVVGGQNVSANNLGDRLTAANNFVRFAQSVGDVALKVKTFYTENIFTAAHDIWNERAKRFPYKLDGLVFTPIFKPYFNKDIYKWKHLDTIDFAIAKQSKGQTSEVWKLMVAGFDGSGAYSHFNFKGIDGNGLFMHRHKGGTLTQEKLQIPHELGTVSVTPATGKKYPDGAVIEFKFDSKKNSFVPVKHREDKQFANGVSATNDAWVSITDPITKADLKKGVYIFCGRKYHNAIKDRLISQYMSRKSVLDIGSGAGGDIHKYVRHKASRVIGIDIVDVEYDHPRHMKFFKTDTELYDIQDMIKNEGISKFDVVNCQFALHYFFKSKSTLDNFISNVTRSLKSGGLLVVTYLDADLVKKALGNNGVYETPTVRIDSSFKAGEEKLTGQRITVALKGTKYFKQTASKEYLVYPKKFVEYLGIHGFQLVNSVPFGEYCTSLQSECNLMNSNEKAYSFMNTSMVFRYS